MSNDTIEWVDVCADLRAVCDKCEELLARSPEATRRHHEIHLARHNILDAIRLLSCGRITPDDLVWGHDVVARLVAEGHDKH